MPHERRRPAVFQSSPIPGLIEVSLDHGLEADKTFVDFLGQMGPEVVQFDGKSDEETASGKIFLIHQVAVPVIFENADDFSDGVVDPVHPVKTFRPPDLSPLAEDLMEKILLVFKIVEKPALGDLRGRKDVAEGRVQKSMKRKQPQRLVDDLFLAGLHS